MFGAKSRTKSFRNSKFVCFPSHLCVRNRPDSKLSQLRLTQWFQYFLVPFTSSTSSPAIVFCFQTIYSRWWFTTHLINNNKAVIMAQVIGPESPWWIDLMTTINSLHIGTRRNMVVHVSSGFLTKYEGRWSCWSKWESVIPAFPWKLQCRNVQVCFIVWFPALTAEQSFHCELNFQPLCHLLNPDI